MIVDQIIWMNENNPFLKCVYDFKCPFPVNNVINLNNLETKSDSSPSAF